MNRKMEQHSTKTITKGYQKSKRHFQCPDRNAVRAARKKADLIGEWKKKEVVQKILLSVKGLNNLERKVENYDKNGQSNH